MSQVFSPTLWSKELQRLLKDAGVMDQCVNRSHEGEIKNEGDSVKINSIVDINISDYVKGTAMTVQTALDGTQQILTVDQKKYFSFVVDDIDKVQANINLVEAYMANAKKNILLAKDTFLLTKRADAHADNQIGDITADKATIYGYFVDLFTKLADSNAIDTNGKGDDGKRPWVIVSPKILAVIKKAPEMIHASKDGDDIIRKGAVTEFAGFDVLSSTNMKAVSGKTLVLAGTNEAITYADQIIKVRSVQDKDEFGDFVSGLYVYGAKTVQPKALATMNVVL